MPTRYIAYLRAINVGGRTVRMAALRALFESWGYVDVKTFIASGNVIFREPDTQKSRRAAAAPDHIAKLEASLESALADALGFQVAVFVRTAVDNWNIAHWTPNSAKPFPAPGESLYVGFLKSAPDLLVRAAITAYESEVDRFYFNANEMYWLCRKTIGTSDVSGARLEKLLGSPTTMRNVTTVWKLALEYPAD